MTQESAKGRKKRVQSQNKTLGIGLIKRIMPLVTLTFMVLTIISTAVSMYAMRNVARSTLTSAAAGAKRAIQGAIIQISAVTETVADCAMYLNNSESINSVADSVIEDNIYILDIDVIDHNGKSMLTGDDLSKQDVYLKVRNTNKPFVSDVSYDNRTGCHMFYIAVPVIKGDVYKGVVETKIDAKMLKDYIADVAPGNTGTTFVTDGHSTCIAAENEMLMFNRVNMDSLRDYNFDYKSLSQFITKINNTGEGFANLKRPSGIDYATFCEVDQTQSWRIVVVQSVMDYSGSVYLCFFAMVVLSIIAWIVIVLRLSKLSDKVSLSLKNSADRLKLICAGDFERLDSLEQRRGECFEVEELFVLENELAKNMCELIDETERALDHMTGGDENNDTGNAFAGDYGRIKQALDRNIEAVNVIITRISRAAEEVARGSAQMAAGAVGLSIGASQQASAVSQLFTNVANMARGVENISAVDNINFSEAGNLYSMLSDPTSKRSKMELMIAAMGNIAQTSEEIRKIASMIEGIASETGILAFNASVEAARAGSAGRGFSVIASEVRQLADRSKESLESIKVQMNRIFEAIAVGKEMVDETVSAVNNMRRNVEQVKESLSQISSVIDNTAATSQETAAACEELSAQAALLRDLVSQFSSGTN